MDEMIYLDNAATTKPRSEVISQMLRVLEEDYGNPSSPHNLGLQAEKHIKGSRQSLARAIGADQQEVYFTSGGTEANNWAIRMGARHYARFGKHLITTAIEHPSVLKTFRELVQEGFEVTYLPVDEHGVIDLNDLEEALREDTILVSLMFVNNEIGSIQPVVEAGRMIRDIKRGKKGLFHPLYHIDAVQALGKLSIDVKELNVDLMSFSAHKLHGPKGSGALYKRKDLPLPAYLTGGEQEGALRSGTENVPGIVGFGKAVELAHGELAENIKKMRELKVKLAEGILDGVPETWINGPRPGEGAPHILNISFAGLKAEVLVHALSDRGIYISTRSACSARKASPSHVLQALGVDQERLASAVRFSLSPFNTPQEVEYTLDQIEKTVKSLRRVMGGGRK